MQVVQRYNDKVQFFCDFFSDADGQIPIHFRFHTEQVPDTVPMTTSVRKKEYAAPLVSDLSSANRSFHCKDCILCRI